MEDYHLSISLLKITSDGGINYYRFLVTGVQFSTARQVGQCCSAVYSIHHGPKTREVFLVSGLPHHDAATMLIPFNTCTVYENSRKAAPTGTKKMRLAICEIMCKALEVKELRAFTLYSLLALQAGGHRFKSCIAQYCNS